MSSTNGTAWTQYYFITNLQGDVLQVYRVSDRAIVASYSYDSWGNILNATGEKAEENPFWYRGYYYDAETGFYATGTRYYDPVIGRFINADDIAMLGANGDFASLNLYAYCGNNPIIRADHSGEFWHIVAGAAIGAAIGAVSSIVAQAVSGQGINWVEVGISAASGAITGAINTAIPGMGIAATGLTQGIVGAATYAATEKFAYDRNPSLSGTIAAGLSSGLLAGGAKAISKALTTMKLYRAVSPAEANSFAQTGQLSTGAGQMEGKFFATSKANAKTWGTLLGSDQMISIRVPKNALLHSSVEYFKCLDAIGPAYYFSDMSYLNSIIQ